MHVVVRENDVNFVKNSFESNVSGKNGNLTMIIVSDNNNMNL